jgi:molecular chaperone DnaJ
MKGANLHTSVKLTFEEAVFGCKKEIELTVKENCKTCNGTGAKPGTSPETCTKCGGKGQVVFTQQSFFGTVRNVQTCPDCKGTGKIIKEKCSDCHGSGYIPMKKRYSVDIPAGIENGQAVNLPGLGEPGINGGPRGDVRVEAIVGRHPIFQRQDVNIYSTVPVSFAVAALGGEILIDTVDGKVIYDVKPGTQTDTKVRLKGKGVPSWRNKDIRGDHYVTLVVQVPDKLKPEAKELLKQFDALSGDSLNAVKNATSSGTDTDASDGNDKDSKDKKKKFWK